MPLRAALLLVLSLGLLAACSTTEPLPEPTPEPERAAPERPAPPPPDSVATPEPTPAPERPAAPEPEPEPESDPLYEQTEDALRLAFTDGLFGLYRAEADPASAQRLDRAGIAAWMTDLALVSPRAAELARAALGPVLDQRFVVGFVLPNAAQAECASIRDVLYVPVPERFQGPDRPFTGYLVQDACDVSAGETALFCSGGFGTTDAGASCSCTCTAGEAPGLSCVSC